MMARAAHLIKEALELSPEERVDVATELLASVEEAHEDVEEAWAEEIERRAGRVLSDESAGTPWAETRARIVERVLSSP
jgi:putative addiction module component (TIGR02574 family)